MEFTSDFILEEFEKLVNNDFVKFIEEFDPESARSYPPVKLSNELSKGDFSVMLKGVLSQKAVIKDEDLAGIPPKEQKVKKVELQNKFADEFALKLLLAFQEFTKKTHSLVERTEYIAGFLNIFVSHAVVYQAGINAIINRLGENFGRSSEKKGQRVIIEHTSSNPNGPLHIGNLRNVMLGGHLSELFKSVGYDVKQHFYVNDLGAQIGLTALGYKKVYHKIEPKLKIDQWIGMIYAIMNTMNELQQLDISLADVYAAIIGRHQIDQALKPSAEKAQEIPSAKLEKIVEFLEIMEDLNCRQPELCLALVYDCQGLDIKKEFSTLNLSYEQNDFKTVKLFRTMVTNCLSGVQKTLDIYNIHHDNFDFESELGWEGSNERVMEIMKKSPYFVEATQKNEKGVAEGGYLRLKDYIQDKGFKVGKGGFQHDYPNFYVLRPDGSTLYTFRDVVYSLKKVGNADLVFNIIASEQNLPQQKVSLSLNLLDPKSPQKQFHISYELVKLLRNGVVAKMSGRRARYILADELYQELKDTVKKMMIEKNPSINAESVDDQKFLEMTAAEIATASMKYTLLATGSRHQINFDIIKAADPRESSTGAYLLYNATRFFSLIRKFNEGITAKKWPALPSVETVNFSRLGPDEWRMFLKFAMAFPRVVYETACPKLVDLPSLPDFSTNKLCDHLMSLAHEFSTFYGKHKILLQDDVELLHARIYWALSLKQTMENGLRILTIKAVERM